MQKSKIFQAEGRVLVWISKTPNFDVFHDHLYDGSYFLDFGIDFEGSKDDFVPLHSDEAMTSDSVIDVEDISPFLGKFLVQLKKTELSSFNSMMLLYDHDFNGEIRSSSICQFIGSFEYDST